MHKFATICLAGALCFSFSGIRAEASSLSLAEEGIASVMTEAQTADPDADEKVLEDMTPSEFEGVCIAKVNDYVNVRSEANEDSEVLGKLYDKSAGTVDGEENGWYKITSGSVTGYVKADYVVTGDAAEELAKEVGKRVATVTTQTLRVRTDATTDASVLGLIGEGEELTVTDEQDGFVKVSIEEGDGWVSTDYVDLRTDFVQAESKAEEEARLAKEAAAKEEGKKKAQEAAAKTKAESGSKAVVGSGAGSSSGNAVVGFASQFVGNPYVYGGTSLTNGTDCSGFVMGVYSTLRCEPAPFLQRHEKRRIQRQPFRGTAGRHHLLQRSRSYLLWQQHRSTRQHPGHRNQVYFPGELQECYLCKTYFLISIV